MRVIVGASAATLGGLSSSGLGSDNSVVAACDTDGISIAYTTAYNATAQEYQVSAVNFTGVNAGFYEFRVRARDNAGAVSPWSTGPGNAIAVDTIAPFITPTVWLPVVPDTN